MASDGGSGYLVRGRHEMPSIREPEVRRVAAQGSDLPHDLSPSFEIVAMASSAGGLNALTSILSRLPGDLPAPIVVVQHLDPRHRSLMAGVLSKRTPLRVVEASDGQKLEAGTVYIAPPDRHLLVNADGTLSLTYSELVHFVRPSADLLFESVAASYRERCIGVVLTGTGSDGAMGVKAIGKMGGTVIAQDEASSEFYGMPSAAIETGYVHFVLPLEEISPAIVSLIEQDSVI
jgi:two-component system chemotaxis response regulator CheB